MSIMYRHKAVLAAAVMASCVLSGLPERAVAFELFGIKLFGDDESKTQIADPVRYSVTLQSSDPTLESYLKDQSALVSDESEPVDGDFGLAVKARDDRDRLIAALYEKAHYGAVVTVRVDGTPIEDLPPVPKFDNSKPVPVTVNVDVGPEFRLGAVKLEGDASQLDAASYGLVPGGNAGSVAVISASEKMVQTFRKEGRPLAKLSERQVVADHNTNTVSVTIGVNAGPVAPIGEVTVEGASEVDPAFVSSWSDLHRGENYSPEKLQRTTKRLNSLGTFSSVTVREGDKLQPDGTIPVKIHVSEGKQRYFGFGAQMSSTDGLGLQGYWGHHNLFGHAESLRISGSVSRLGQTKSFSKLDYSTAVAFIKPGAFGPATTFNANLGASVTHTDGYFERKLSGDAGVSYQLNDQDTLSVGTAVQWSQSQDVYGNNSYLTALLPFAWARDATDNKLNPTTGYRASVTVTPSYEFKNKVAFTSVEGTVSAYQKIGDNGPVLAARLSAGSLLGVGYLGNIPASRRFYAGGGGSIRGYSYQGVSPRNAAGDELGGKSYVVTSFEARFNVTKEIGIVPFLDVGTVSSSSMPNFSDIRAGAGLGLRYATPFGPLRLDVAVPLRRYPGGSRYGVYAGIGQAF